MIVKHLKSEIIKESMGGGVEEDEEKVKERVRGMRKWKRERKRVRKT